MTELPHLIPPKWAAAVIRRAAGPREAPYVLSDLEEEFEELAALSGTPAATRWYVAQAVRSLGPLIRNRFRPEPHRSYRRSVMHFLSDIRIAMRLLARRPASSLAVALTIAVAVGATTALLAAVHGLLIQPLPFPDPERLMWVHTTTAGSPDGTRGNGNPADLEDLRREAGTFAALAAWAPPDEVTLRLDGEAWRGRMAEMTPGIGEVLGLPPAAGRYFAPEDFGPGVSVVVLTHRTWRTVFGADPTVIGRSLYVDDRPANIVGVAPDSRGAFDPDELDVWVPRRNDTRDIAERRGDLFLTVVGRLRPGVEIGQAREEVSALMARFAQAYPNSNDGRGARVEPYLAGLVGDIEPTLLLIGITVALALAIASGNVAIILLARAHGRRREFAVRAAIGGSPGRITGQLLAETSVLAAVGGLAGLAVAPTLLDVLVALYPGDLPRATDLGLSPTVVVAAAAIAMVAALLAVVPSARLARASGAGTALRDSERGALSRRSRRFGATLVGGQVAMTVVLLFGGVLLLRSLWALSHRDPGFAYERLVAFSLAPTPVRYPTDGEAFAYFDRVLERLRAVPGVRAAGYSTLLPYDDTNLSSMMWPEGVARTREEAIFPLTQGVSADYTSALGLRLVRGRGFRPDDARAGRPVALINESLVERLYPSGAVVGRRLYGNGQELDIVGVVADKRHRDLRAAPLPEVFIPREQTWFYSRAHWFVVRVDARSQIAFAMLDRAVRDVDPRTPPAHFTWVDDRIAQSLAPERFRGVLVGSLGALALVLTVLGVWGMVAHFVSRQTRDIGIRIALGQSPGRARGAVVGDALAVVGTGLGVGVVGALVAGRLLRAFLIDVPPSDPVSLAAIALLFLAVTWAAAAGPARRASRIDPLTAIRAD